MNYKKTMNRIGARAFGIVITSGMVLSPVSVYAQETGAVVRTADDEEDSEKDKDKDKEKEEEEKEISSDSEKDNEAEQGADQQPEKGSAEEDPEGSETDGSGEASDAEGKDQEDPGKQEDGTDVTGDQEPDKEKDPEDKEDSGEDGQDGKETEPETEQETGSETDPEKESGEDDADVEPEKETASGKDKESETEEGSETGETEEGSEIGETEEGSDAEKEPAEKEQKTEPGKDVKDKPGKDGKEQKEKDEQKDENKEDSDEEQASRTFTRPQLSSKDYNVSFSLSDKIDAFRFWTVEKVYGFAKSDLSVFDSMQSGKEVGRLKAGDVAFVLCVDVEENWLYVESGDVRGFVRKDMIAVNSESDAVLEKLAAAQGVDTSKDDWADELDLSGLYGKATVPYYENDAYAYVHMTTQTVVIDKAYALPVLKDGREHVDILEGMTASSEVVGTLPKDGFAYVIKDVDKNWLYVESGDVRGFVPKNLMECGDEVDEFVNGLGENEFEKADMLVSPEDNRATYYTLTSVKSGISTYAGMELVKYAKQFIGCPYVFGGNSLSQGCDCSGFAQQLYRAFGYEIPRGAIAQSEVGRKIAVEDAQPGDLIFYADGEGVYHVVVYAGDGMTVEAKSEEYGILSEGVDYDVACWATRMFPEDATVKASTGTLIALPQGLGDVYTFMGWQMITAPSSDQYALREKAGMVFDEEGFGIVDGRYVIAMTQTYGRVGDYVDIYLANGTVLPCIIGDIKGYSDPGVNEWGHMHGQNVVEFVVDTNTWYDNGHANPGTESCHPEWKSTVEKVVNLGSYFDQE